jgi:hypothetical protein
MLLSVVAGPMSLVLLVQHVYFAHGCLEQDGDEREPK